MQIRKVKPLLMIIAMILIIGFIQPDLTFAAESDFTWSENADGTITITDYKGSDPSISIPGLLDGKTVTGIGNNAFYHKNISSIQMPATITSIGEYAFATNQITSVMLPNGIKKLGRNAFSNNSLQSVTIPGTVTTIENNAFTGNDLQSVTISNGVKTIENAAFSRNELTTVNLPSSVTSIGNNAFGHNSIQSIDIPSEVTRIGESAFANNQLKNVIIPDNVTSLGAGAFQNNQLENIRIPSGIRVISSYTFARNNLSSIQIPESVTEIETSAFANNKLESIIFPDSVALLGTNAFSNNSLTKVTIPESVTTIRGFTFSNNSISEVTVMNKDTSFGADVFRGNQQNSADLTVIGYNPSTAKDYAETYGHTFRVFDSTQPDPDESLERIDGSSRYSTAIEVSQRGWTSADTVILARGDEFADALAGVPLAHKLDAPILMTVPDRLLDNTRTEMKRLGAKNVVILGGEAAISRSVSDELKNSGLNVERIDGSSRFETAALIASELTPNGTSKVVVANGMDFPDALSAASSAAKEGLPILLTLDQRLPAATSAKLNDLGVQETIVVGGENVVAENVKTQLPQATRLDGADRYGTNTAIAEYFGVESKHLYVATGQNYADALTGAVLAAKNNSTILLVHHRVPSVVTAYLNKHKAESLSIFGGEMAVSKGVENELRELLQ